MCGYVLGDACVDEYVHAGGTGVSDGVSDGVQCAYARASSCG